MSLDRLHIQIPFGSSSEILIKLADDDKEALLEGLATNEFYVIVGAALQEPE